MHTPRHYITLLRLPLAVGVVFIHSLQRPLPKGIPPCEMGFVDQLRWCCSSALPSVAVALFFIIAGFLFFQGYQADQGLRFFLHKWHKRIYSLLIPYLLWNGMKFLQVWSKHGWDSFSAQWQRVEGFNLFWGKHTIAKGHYSLLHFPLGSFDAPLNVPLWFLRDLMLFLLLSPLLALLLRRKVGAVATLLLLFTLYYLRALPYPLGISLPSLPMFALGAAVALHHGDLYAPLRRWRWLLFPSWFVLIGLQWSGHSGHNIVMLTTAVSLASYIALAGTIADRWGQPSARFEQLSQASFMIYAGHIVGVLGSSTWLVKTCLPGHSPWLQALHYLLPPLLAVAFLIALFLFLQRYFPTLSAPLTGLRGSSLSSPSQRLNS